MLIVDIGNCHLGDMDIAKNMIRIAHECGADLIKGQAFLPDNLIGKGSMPDGFYKQCAMSCEQYAELIDYARSIGSDLFYSIFTKPDKDDPFALLRVKQNWHKVTGSQTRDRGAFLRDIDHDNFIVSVPKDMFLPKLRDVNKLSLLYVSDYMVQNPVLSRIDDLHKISGHLIGYSDHTVGIDWAYKAHVEYGVPIIEKHFTLTRNIMFDGVVFRDSLHGADPKELEALASRL